MLGNDAMEFLKALHILDNIWNEVEDAEYNDRQLTQFAERYHEHKLKLLGIADVVGQSEQLPCGDLMKHNFSLSKIGRCITCDRAKEKAN